MLSPNGHFPGRQWAGGGGRFAGKAAALPLLGDRPAERPIHLTRCTPNECGFGIAGLDLQLFKGGICGRLGDGKTRYQVKTEIKIKKRAQIANETKGERQIQIGRRVRSGEVDRKNPGQRVAIEIETEKTLVFM